MKQFVVLIGAFFITIFVSELFLRKDKLQTKIRKILAVHAFMLFLAFLYLRSIQQTSLVVVAIFWAGAFLSWFGIRSHIESSILLRMIYLLRSKPMSKRELMSKYKDHYGEEKRIEELIRAGLLQSRDNVIAITKKGEFIYRNASRFR